MAKLPSILFYPRDIRRTSTHFSRQILPKALISHGQHQRTAITTPTPGSENLLSKPIKNALK